MACIVTGKEALFIIVDHLKPDNALRFNENKVRLHLTQWHIPLPSTGLGTERVLLPPVRVVTDDYRDREE